VDYGLSIGQVEQQLAANNVNAGGSFRRIRAAADQRARAGADQERRRHPENDAEGAERASLRVRDVAV